MEKEEKIKIYNIVEEIKGYQKEIARLKLENKELKEELEKYKKIVLLCNRGLDKMQELESSDSKDE